MFKKTVTSSAFIFLITLTFVWLLISLISSASEPGAIVQADQGNDTPALTGDLVLENTTFTGTLIVVAGRGEIDSPIQPQIHNAANAVYNLFRTQGYPSEQIYYLATDLTLDGDGDEQADVDAMATEANLEYAVTQWATDKVGPDGILTLYLISYGKYDCLYLDEINTQRLTPGALDGWLDQLEAAMPGLRVNVIVESSYAGSFIDLDSTVSQAGRVVIASTSAQDNAYASQDGAVFSDAFFLSASGADVSLWTAFDQARWTTQQSYPDQTPWLDGDGDGTPNEAEDEQEASQRSLFQVLGDAYEPNDACQQAQAITIDGSIQIHTFHDQADEDWGIFQAITGTTYLIEVQPPPSSTADVVLELYDSCNSTGLFSQNHTLSNSSTSHLSSINGSTVRLPFRAFRDGPFFLRVLNYAPSVYGSHVEYYLSIGTQDAYEQDDTCAQASALTTDGAAQQHTFHRQADEDWARFTVVSGTTYVLQAASTSPDANMILELYEACDEDPAGSDDDAFGSDARIIFSASSSGDYYVKALNHDPDAYGPDVTYELSVRAQSPGPIVVIVAGRNEVDQLEDNITFMGDQAYRTFRRAGIPRENIRYLSVGDNRDADQDGYLDVDDTPTWENVRYAVRDWPGERGVQPGRPFYLYLTDHGGTDYYCAMGCVSGTWVRAEDLDLWLGDLETATGADEVNVIIEACYSGSFIDVTTYGPAEMTAEGRVVIASTGSRVRAFASERGGYFSDAFFTALGDNADLWTAYVAGRTAARAAWPEQTPWLDDNGDAVADGSDGSVAWGRGLAAFGGGAIPVVDRLDVGEINASGAATITAQIRDDVAIVTATVEIYAPGLTVSDTEEGEMPILLVDREGLRDDDGDGVYEGVYAGFTEAGLYRLMAYAQDNDGNLSLPRETTVGESRVYLPLMLKNR